MHDKDMDGLWVGPQPPDQFINDHTVKPPTSAGPIPNKGKISFEDGSQVDESTLIKALKVFCTEMTMEDTHKVPGQGECAEALRKADMGVFNKTDNPLASSSTSDSPSTPSSASSSASSSSTLPTTPPGDLDDKRLVEIFSKMLFFFELKYKNPEGKRTRCEDPFNAPKGQENKENYDPRKGDHTSKAVRGQMMSYAMTMFENAHRTFVFSVLIMDDEARLVRWDRSGAIFSERFNWKTTTYLARFLWRFNFMTAAQRGFDTTVSVPNDQEIQLARSAFDDARERLSYHTLPDKNETLRRFEVWDGNDCHVVIAGRPQSYPRTLPGRSTFGYIGVDITDTKTPTVVYLKDTWRISLPGMPIEGKVYQDLKKQNVPYLPDYRYGGDVPLERPSASTRPRPNRKAQVTVTQDYASKSWAYKTQDIHPLTHHRIVLGKIGRPLNTFKTTKELCQALLHALECHWLAFHNARTLHRDVSANNIMIDEDGNGMLIDWDLCWFMDDIGDPRRRWRTGTVQFMSVAIFKQPFKRDHLLRDDLESFVHVLFHHVLKYRPTLCAQEGDFAKTFINVFDSYTEGDDDAVVGGNERRSMLLNSIFTSEELTAGGYLPKPLTSLMNDARDLFEPLYLPEREREPRKALLSNPGIFSPEIFESRRRENKAQAPDADADVEARRQSTIESLKSSVDLWCIFKDHLESPGWRDDDGAQLQLSENAIASVLRPGETKATTGTNNGGKSGTKNGRKRRTTLVDGKEHELKKKSAAKRLRLNDGSRGTVSLANGRPANDSASSSVGGAAVPRRARSAGNSTKKRRSPARRL